MKHVGERVCTLTMMITGLVANDDDPIEMSGGIILPEDGFDEYIELSIKMDEVMKLPRYRFNRQQLLSDYFCVMQNTFVELKELEDEGTEFEVVDIEEKLLEDFNVFLDACLVEDQRFTA